MYGYQIGVSYNFATLAPAILGAQFNSAKLVATMDHATAAKFTNIDQQSQIIYPNLPAGTPSDPTQYVYLRFQTSANTFVILANVWINETTIVVAVATTITAVISNVTTADVTTIRNMLIAAGYSSITLTAT